MDSRIDRVNSLYSSPVSFVYEITFHSQTLGLNLCQHEILGPSYSTHIIQCCAVIDASGIISNTVQPGDIILKINDTNLLAKENEEFDFENITQIITTTSNPRTLKIFRMAGRSYNLLPSYVEISLLLAETNVSAKFIVSGTIPPTIQTIPLSSEQGVSNFNSIN